MKKKKKSTQIYSTPWIKHSIITQQKAEKKKTLINNNRLDEGHKGSPTYLRMYTIEYFESPCYLLYNYMYL